MSAKSTKSKPASAPKRRPQRNEAQEAKRLQRETLAMLRTELKELHEMSLLAMAEAGILPPLYGGDYLGEGKNEAVPLWAMLKTEEDEEEQVLAMLMLRLMPGAEPNTELRAERADIGLENIWPIAEFVETIEKESGMPLPLTDEEKKAMMLFPLTGPQLKPVNMSYMEMSDHIADGLPFAVLVKIPTSGEGDDFNYDWDNIENYQADIICEESPQVLETAVWDYRLELAIQLGIQIAESEAEEPEKVLIAMSLPDLVGIYEVGVRGGMRFYGSTSVLRENQEQYDVLREEDGTLVIKTPLKVGLEPVEPLAEGREDLNKNAAGMELFRIAGNSDALENTWSQLRAYNFFCLRTCQGEMKLGKNGQPILEGYSDTPSLSWLMGDSLDTLYHLIHLISLYELLSLTGLVKGQLQRREIGVT